MIEYAIKKKITRQMEAEGNIHSIYTQWLSGKESPCSSGATGDMGLITGWEDLLEEGMATHSSIFSWRIP